VTGGARWGVFLDRDGTLVPDAAPARRPDQLRLYAGTGDGLRLLGNAGATLIVVSNQSVVARGGLDAAGLRRMDRRLRALAREERSRIHEAYYCPHYPPITGPCSCRKPEPGLIRRGLRAFSLRARECFLVGDTATDMEAGRRAGLATVLVLTGYGRRSRAAVLRRGMADHVSRDLAGAARWILRERERRA
jgi:D-glycero-D-manno-heptose 1,7-bisphosphate phosphatase